MLTIDTNLQEPKNVLGTKLKPCCFSPMTGYFRDGYCRTDLSDFGTHTVCVIITEDFLAFSKARGNDLSTPRPEYQFVGLKEGDKWCLCATRWAEAFKSGMAPRVVLEATHRNTLEFIDLADLKANQFQGM